MDPLTDNFLMAKVKEGDADKMSLLFKRYHQSIYKFVYYQVGDPAGSEDIVQNIFYRILKYKDSFSGDGEFRTWIYHIARNAINDHFRKTKKIDYKDNIVAISDTHHAGKVSPEAEKKSDHHLVLLALQHLKEEQREILVMCKYQDMTYKEIAVVLNTNENNVKIKVHRAIKELKDVYFKLDK